MRNHSYENELRLKVHFNANQIHFSARSRFETEAQSKSKIVHGPYFL